ncbi:MAG: hypothetical protein A3A00_00760 [Candidatus Spechtbacteria bacterium RIFCSPLOWO2_01_FULL_38_20]|nr:MAG: hypothetical protein A3A00_00760 [Candidatus Spechtbacteria bacterium RIFCSPLOWO2_01_FULL_38_20]
MEPKVIYEDKNLIVINKPSGLLVHATNKNEADTVVDWVIKKYPEIKGVGDGGRDGRPLHEATERHGIVHRLDKETSGLLVIARNSLSYERLKDLFRTRQIQKKYYALVWGSPQQNRGVIKKDIKAYKGKRQTVEVYSQTKTSKARASETHWQVIKQYKEYALMDVQPLTGRTHQIRVHLDSIGHPVVCDKLYGKKKRCPSGLGRLFLHAYFLRIPFDKNTVLEFEEEMPKDLSNFLKSI